MHALAGRRSVRYWDPRKAYCCWFQGTQHVLAEGPDDFTNGPTYQSALDTFKQIVAVSTAGQAKDLNTCRVICELYLRHIATRRNPRTLKHTPTATEIMEHLTICQAVQPLLVVYEAAMKYEWSDEDRSKITACYQNVNALLAEQVQADAAMAEAERAGMQAAASPVAA